MTLRARLQQRQTELNHNCKVVNPLNLREVRVRGNVEHMAVELIPFNQPNNLMLQPGDADADLGTMFIVRADGTVLHASRRGWFSNIEKVELMPGDTLVVPGKTNRETFWTAFTRGLKDWSQILYQFGLSAAAIKTLRN